MIRLATNTVNSRKERILDFVIAGPLYDETVFSVVTRRILFNSPLFVIFFILSNFSLLISLSFEPI